jgi:hypothetical protein
MINASLLQRRNVLKFNIADGTELVAYLEAEPTNTVTSLSSGHRICHGNGSFDGRVPIFVVPLSVSHLLSAHQ